MSRAARNLAIVLLACAAAGGPPAGAEPPPHMPAAPAMPVRLDGVINVKQFGAKGDGVTDDTAAFKAALAAATGASASRASNQGAAVTIPAGKYILTSKLTIHLDSNAALAIFGASQAATELQWNVADGGLDFEYPQQGTESNSRNPARLPGVSLDVERLSLVNNAPGNVFTGTALLLQQPIPKNSIASFNPDSVIRDVSWYSLLPGQGGSSAQGQDWNVGIQIKDVSNVHIDHVNGTQWASNRNWGSSSSAGIDIVSNGPAKDYFQQQIWINDFSQHGAYYGLLLRGHSIQGVYASRLFLLENAFSINWLAPNEDASASFFLGDSSLDGYYASINLANVKQVFIHDNEILGGTGPTPMTANYYAIRANVTNDFVARGNVIIPPCAHCRSSNSIAPGYAAYGIQVLHHAGADNQASVIEGNSIAFGDVGISAGGGQILVADNAISSEVATPIQLVKGYAASPAFTNNQYGADVVSGAGNTKLVPSGGGRAFEAGFKAPSASSAACSAGQAGDAAIGGRPYHFYCYAANRWGRVPMSTTGW